MTNPIIINEKVYYILWGVLTPLKGDIIAVDKDGECKSCQG